MLEETYKQCLAHEMRLGSISYQIEVALPVIYKGKRLDCGYRVDLLVEYALMVELKSVDQLKGIHKAQLITYLKLSGIKEGLLINFNVTQLKDGLRRFTL